jgi:hypothetical protein
MHEIPLHVNYQQRGAALIEHGRRLRFHPDDAHHAFVIVHKSLSKMYTTSLLAGRIVVLLPLLMATPHLFAETASPLEQHFIGRRARVLLDMPGDNSGVDVHVSAAPAVDANLVEARLAKYGAALRKGAQASVTLVKLKGDHIEFHLDGGGFTDRELFLLPGYDSSRWGFTEEEHKLRYRISGTRDKDRRRRLESDYDRLRRRRIQPLREKYEREVRSRHGSRFNLCFPSASEAASTTPEQIVEMLRPYVELP